MGIVNVSHFETGTLTRKTAGTKSRHTTFMRHLGQRIGLVHKLRKSIGTEEGIDDRWNSFGVDQIDRGKHLIVAHIHSFTNRTRHTSESHTELVIELFTDRTHTTIAQVVDIVDVGLGVDQLDKVLNNSNDIFFGKYLYIGRYGES